MLGSMTCPIITIYFSLVPDLHLHKPFFLATFVYNSMNMKPIIFLFFVGNLLFLSAQEMKSEAPLYKYRLEYGICPQNRGALGFMRFAFGEKSWQYYVDLEASSMRGSKELKIRSLYMDLPEGSRYVSDKINRFTVISPRFGFTKAIFPKSSYNKIETTVGISAGFALGCMRPYYLNVLVQDPINPGTSIIIEDKADIDKYTYGVIVGETTSFRHLTSIQYFSGLSLQAFSYFNLNRRNNLIRGVELSVQAYIFPKKIPIMQVSPNQSSFITVGIGFVQGHKF